jgi:hypothetical protein
MDGLMIYSNIAGLLCKYAIPAAIQKKSPTGVGIHVLGLNLVGGCMLQRQSANSDPARKVRRERSFN